ncbi:MAG: sigma-70 family RNA polymerase sigma factor [Fuerstiella sp.]
MSETSMTLLNRLQQTDDPETWDRLVRLYGPLLTIRLRKYDVQSSDADDLVQDVLMAVSKDLKSFDHNGRTGAFRTWLRGILVNRLRNFWRARGRRPQVQDDSDIDRRLSQLEDPASEMSQLWNRQHDRHIARQLLALSQPLFAPATWTACSRVAIDGERSDVVATELGISVNAVFIAKSRVLSRLRQEVAGLVEASSDFPASS